MKVTRLLSTILGAGSLMLAAFGTAAAQAGAMAPTSQLGIGVTVDNSSGAGMTIQYAFSPSVQIGAEVGLGIGSSDAQSLTSFAVGPYVRWILEGKVNPIIQAGIRSFSTTIKNKTLPGEPESTTDGQQLYAGFGLEWYHNRNVGVYVMADVLHLDFDPSVTSFGTLNGRAGVEWFFEP